MHATPIDEITLQDEIREIGREIGVRRAVYPRFVSTRKITQAEADHRLAVLEAVYRRLKAAQRIDAHGDAT